MRKDDEDLIEKIAKFAFYHPCISSTIFVVSFFVFLFVFIIIAQPNP